MSLEKQQHNPKRRTIVTFIWLLPVSMAIWKTLWTAEDRFDEKDVKTQEEKAKKKPLPVEEAVSWDLADLKMKMFEDAEMMNRLPTPQQAVTRIGQFIVAIFQWGYDFVTKNPQFKQFLQQIHGGLVAISKKLPWLLQQLANKAITAAQFVAQLSLQTIWKLIAYLWSKLKVYISKLSPQFLKNRYAKRKATNRQQVWTKIQQFAMKALWIFNSEEFLQMLWKISDAEEAHKQKIREEMWKAIQGAFGIQYR